MLYVSEPYNSLRSSRLRYLFGSAWFLLPLMLMAGCSLGPIREYSSGTALKPGESILFLVIRAEDHEGQEVDPLGSATTFASAYTAEFFFRKSDGGVGRDDDSIQNPLKLSQNDRVYWPLLLPASSEVLLGILEVSSTDGITSVRTSIPLKLMLPVAADRIVYPGDIVLRGKERRLGPESIRMEENAGSIKYIRKWQARQKGGLADFELVTRVPKCKPQGPCSY